MEILTKDNVEPKKQTLSQWMWFPGVIPLWL